ncbi:FGGY-family carbohydrate kinase [Echinicola sediminis]
MIMSKISSSLKNEGFMVIDVGTGNVRVAIVSKAGDLLGIERDNMVYHKDSAYPEALYFSPNVIWAKIIDLIRKINFTISEKVEIIGVTASSQREGIVLLDDNGDAVIGFPNHDHRGREWENLVIQPQRVYELTGRRPSSLFSALKLVGTRERRSDVFQKTSSFTSISDWVQYQCSGVLGYEHAQASETLLYDVVSKSWSGELCNMFRLDPELLPPLHDSGTILGPVSSKFIEESGLPGHARVVVGGADTQLAIKSTGPSVGDIILVGGTTTPVVKITKNYLLDNKQRTWTGRHVEQNQFVLETNAGVTGLNFQRLKEAFYPNEGYEVVQEEVEAALEEGTVVNAVLGSLVAGEDNPITRGGFFFDVPVVTELTRGDFMCASLLDITCSIKENFDVLTELEQYDKDYVWACGGGFQSEVMRTLLSGLLGKKIRLREGYSQASVMGAWLICLEALSDDDNGYRLLNDFYIEDQHRDFSTQFENWKKTRGRLHIYNREEEQL